MATILDLKNKLKSAFDVNKQGSLANKFWGSKAGDSLAKYQQSDLGKAHARAGETTAQILFKNPYEFGKQMANDVGDLYDVAKTSVQTKTLPEVGIQGGRIDNLKKQLGRVLETGSFISGVGAPGTAAMFTGVTGGINYGANRLSGMDSKTAAKKAVATTVENLPKSFQMAGVSRVTNPIIDKASIGKKFITRNLIKSPLNVGEGLLMDKATGYETTPTSIAVDALFPVASDIGSMTFKSADEALRTVKAKVLQSFGKKLRNNKGAYTTVEKYINRTRPYFKSGNYSSGALLGFEPYQDEEGNWKVRFNNEKALAGLGVMFAAGSIKDIRSGGTEDILKSLDRSGNFKNYTKDAREMIANEAKRLAEQVQGVDLVKGADGQGYRASLNPSWYKKFFASEGRAPTNKELFELAEENLRTGEVDGYYPPEEVKKMSEFLDLKPEMKTTIPSNMEELGSNASEINKPRQVPLMPEAPSDKLVTSKKQLIKLFKKTGEVAPFVNELKPKTKPILLKGKLGTYNVEPSEQSLKKITIGKENVEKLQARQDYDNWKRAVYESEGATLTPTQSFNKKLKDLTQGIKQMTSAGGVNADDIKEISGFSAYSKDLYRNFKEAYGSRFNNIKTALLDPFDKAKGNLARSYKNWSDRIDNEVVSGLGIKKGSKESAAVQLFGEGKVKADELINQFGEAKANNIIKADTWFRKEYDTLLAQVNETMRKIYPNNPEKIIPRRRDYYRHFREMAEGVRGLLNIFDSPANISSSLAGVSEYTRPRSKWLSFAQQRLGGATDIDAVGGFIDYVKAAEYNKNIDPFTAQFRSLAEDLRLQTQDKPRLNNLIEYIDDFAGDLAGKTNPADRFVQKFVPGGRKTMRVLSWFNNRVKANVIVGNLSSTIAQIFNVPQGIADAGAANSLKGLGSTVANIFGEATPISKSDFITERYSGNTFDKFDVGVLNNTKKFAEWITGVLDEVGTKYIWNSQYEKALAEGSNNAIKYADDRTRSLVAGRGIGEVPLIQKSKVFQLVAPFQLEVANLWHVMGDWVSEKKFGKIAGLALMSYIFNRGAEAVRGSDVAFDPIQATIEAYNTYKDEEDKRIGALKAAGRISGELISNIPLGQTAAAVYPEFGFKVGDTEMPTREEFFGKGDPTRFGSGLLVMKGAQDPLFKLLPSYGGQQLKRTIDGLRATLRGYSESKTGLVRFPVENTPVRNAQRLLFGEYSTPAARQYFDSETRTLGDNQSAIYNTLLQNDPNKAKAYYDSVINDRTESKTRKALFENEDLTANGDTKEATYPIKGVEVSGYTMGDTFIYKDEDGEYKEKPIKDIEKDAIKYEKEVLDAEYSLEADRLKRLDDTASWIGITTQYVDFLKEYKKGVTDRKDKASIQNKIEDLEDQISKYESYGGAFKKGKKISIKATPMKPIDVKTPTKLSAIKLSGPSMPKIKVRSPQRRTAQKIKIKGLSKPTVKVKSSYYQASK